MASMSFQKGKYRARNQRDGKTRIGVGCLPMKASTLAAEEPREGNSFRTNEDEMDLNPKLDPQTKTDQADLVG